MPITRVQVAVAFLREAAREADVNEDGMLDEAEVANADQELQRMARAMDASPAGIRIASLEGALTNGEEALASIDRNGDGSIDEYEARDVADYTRALLDVTRSLALRPGPTLPEHEVSPRRATDNDAAWPLLGAQLRLGAGIASPVSSAPVSMALSADLSVLGISYTSDAVSLSVTPHVGVLHRLEGDGASRVSGYTAAVLALGSPNSASHPLISGRVGAGFSFGDHFAPHLSAGLDIELAGVNQTTGVSAGIEYAYTDDAHVLTLGVRGSIDVLGALAGASR